MSKETISTEDALLLRLGQMVKENVELELRVHQLMDEYNEVVRQQRGKEKRKDEDPATQTLGQMLQMRDLCDELEKENESLKKYVRAIDVFMRNNKLYSPKDTPCPYRQGHLAVGSMSCLECDSCLHMLYGVGIVCRKTLHGEEVGSAKPCPPHQSNSQ